MSVPASGHGACIPDFQQGNAFGSQKYALGRTSTGMAEDLQAHKGGPARHARPELRDVSATGSRTRTLGPENHVRDGQFQPSGVRHQRCQLIR